MPDIWPMVETSRRRLADELDALTPEQWAAPSLCTGWTVHDVATHLGMGFNVSMPSFIWRMVRNRFDFDRLADQYVRASTAGPAAITADLRANATNRFTPPGLGPAAPLTDLVTHGLDIFRPLGLPHEVPADHAAVVLDLLVSPKAARALSKQGAADGLRLATTDTGWTHGTGPVVAAPAASMILALAGRVVAVPELTGDGADEFRRRLG